VFPPNPRAYAVRTLVTFFLVWLLVACPALCRATADGCCADHEVASGTSDEHHAPAPSDEAANCICGGAIKAPSLRVHGHDSGSPFPAPDPLISDSLPSTRSLVEQLARSGTRPGPADWRGSRRVHALLQDFRC
jgi:hypothetical protein